MYFNHPMFTGLSPSPAFAPMGPGGVAPQPLWAGCFPTIAYPPYANWMMGQSCQWLGGMPFGYGGQIGMPWGGFVQPGVPYGAGGQVGTPNYAGAGRATGPREGGWSAKAGGFVVSDSGRIQVDFKGGETSDDSMLEYRTSGGEWKTLDRPKSAKGSCKWIEADPGSTVEFRIKTGSDKKLRAGSTDNFDDRDHARTSVTDKGVKLSFEDSTDDDFNDAEIEISNASRVG